MSFHETYEFLAIDRPLDTAALAAVRKLSTRAHVSARRFAVSYNYGSFRGDPAEMLARWYDLHLYRSSSSVTLQIKVPAGVVDPQAAAVWELDDALIIQPSGQHLLIQWWREDYGNGWVDDGAVESQAASLADVRAALLQGDQWPLFLGWLAAAEPNDDEEDGEPLAVPVPPGLRATDLACMALAELLGIDADLLAAAAEVSELAGQHRSELDVRTWLASLPSRNKDEALAEVLAGAGGGALDALRSHLAQARQGQLAGAPVVTCTLHELRNRAASIAIERRRAAAERAEAERIAHLKQVARKAPALWKQAWALRDVTNQSGQSEAIQILIDLRAASDVSGSRAAFDRQFREFVAGLDPKRKLHMRLVQAGML